MQQVRDAKRLARAIIDVRSELGMSQAEFATAGGLGLKTVQRIEQGAIMPRGTTLAGLDRAARWPPGESRRILHGESSPQKRSTVPTDPASLIAMSGAEVMRYYEELRERVGKERAMRWHNHVIALKEAAAALTADELNHDAG